MLYCIQCASVFFEQVQLTCLKLDKDHMLNLVKRSKTEGVAFVHASSLTSDDGGAKHVFERGKYKGTFYISKPYNLADMSEALAVVRALNMLRYYTEVELFWNTNEIRIASWQ